ncbi:MAG TPA: 4'-phosphopantetheinyl transferase superfamily protein [Streptosporangiaceae bacterium]
MLLDGLLPAVVAVAETRGDRPGTVLYAAERAVVARAVDTRRGEFAAVRHCARTALRALGAAPAPILPGERGAPLWPAGIVGSMTHCAGYRAAAVARARDIAALGIDAEPDEPLPEGVIDAVALPAERAAIGVLPPGPVCWDRLLFSAKEAVYKAWFPLARRWLGFDDAAIDLHPSGAFHARLRVNGPVDRFTGRWHAANGLIVTAIAAT